MACESTSGLFQVGRCCATLPDYWLKCYSAWVDISWTASFTPVPDTTAILQALRDRVDGTDIDSDEIFWRNNHTTDKYDYFGGGTFGNRQRVCNPGASGAARYPPTSFIGVYNSVNGIGTTTFRAQVGKTVIYDLVGASYCIVNFDGAWPGSAFPPMGCDFGVVEVETAVWDGPYPSHGNKFTVPMPQQAVGENNNVQRNQYITSFPNSPFTSFGGETCGGNQAP